MGANWTDEERERYKRAVLAELMHHVGEENAIGMGELFKIVFDEEWENRINDTRKLRKVITSLRWDGVPVCSTPLRQGGGYFIARTKSELSEQLDRFKRRGLKPLAMAAKMQKRSLPEYLGQISLNLKEHNNDAA